MRDRIAYWLELLAWAAAWGLTLLCLELVAHEDVRRSQNLQMLLAVAVGLTILILTPFVYREAIGIRAAWRARQGFCRACGYSLLGLEPVWAKRPPCRCPECGGRT